MAYPGDLIATIAECFGVPQRTVFQHDRNLVLAGVRNTGGRGKSAIRLTPEDAANLLIAVAGAPISGPVVKESAVTLKKYRALPAWDDILAVEPGDWAGVSALSHLKSGHAFATALAELIRCFAAKKFSDVNLLFPGIADEVRDPGFVHINVGLEGPDPKAFVEVLAHKALPKDWSFSVKRHYYNRIGIKRVQYKQITDANDLIQVRMFSDGTLREIAKLFSNESGPKPGR